MTAGQTLRLNFANGGNSVIQLDNISLEMTVPNKGNFIYTGSQQGTPTVTFPFETDFEVSDGYSVGPLYSDTWWQIDPGLDASIITPGAASSQALDFFGGEAMTLFTDSGAASVSWVDFFIKPVYVDDEDLSPLDYLQLLSAPRSTVTGFIRVQNNSGLGELYVADGAVALLESWVYTGIEQQLVGDTAVDWLRLTYRIDFTTKRWDLFVDDQMVVTDLGFLDTSITELSSFTIMSDDNDPTQLDYFYAGNTNPLFTDTSNDGLPDTWLLLNGLDVNVNQRENDADGDGLLNLAEYQLGTRADLVDTDGDGIADNVELDYDLDPLVDDGGLDPDGDWLTNVDEINFGLDPHVDDVAGAAGFVPRDIWLGVGGNSPRNLTDSSSFPSGFGQRLWLTELAVPQSESMGMNYGQRIHGQLIAPENADYTFWIAGDNGCELWLSTDSTPFNKQLIAYLNQWTGYQQWGKFATQQSVSISLEEGQSYYFEVLHKEGTGEDHVAVAWAYGTTPRAVIGGQHLQVGTPHPNDQDDDGLPDDWELANGLDATDGSAANGFWGNPDGDSLLNYEERLMGDEPVNDPPAAPSDLKAVLQSDGSVLITWSDNSDNESGFILRVNVGGGSTWSIIATPSANVTSHTIAAGNVGSAGDASFINSSYNSSGVTPDPNGSAETEDSNLLTNGSFEQGLDTDSYVFKLSLHDITEGWVPVSGSSHVIEYWGSGMTPASAVGNYNVELDAKEGQYGVQQTVQGLDAGAYVLSWQERGRADSRAGTNAYKVIVKDALDVEIKNQGHTPPTDAWEKEFIIFTVPEPTAGGGTTADVTVVFDLDDTNNEFGSLIDDVRLLKMDIENLREEIITDAFEVSNKVTNQNLDVQASSVGDPRTYRVKLPVDLGSSAKIRFDLYDEDGASVDRNETEEPENGELQISEKTENAETFYATDNFRFVTWDTDDAHAGNQTIKVKLGDTVRMNLVVNGNDLTYFELPIGLPPSESSVKAIRTVDTRFVQLDYGNVANEASPSTLIERMDKVFAQGAVRFNKVGETSKEAVKNLISIRDNATASGVLLVNLPPTTDANDEPLPDSVQINITPTDTPLEVANQIASAINLHYGESRAQAYSSFPNPIIDRGYYDESGKYAHVVLDTGNEEVYNLSVNEFVEGVVISVPDSGLVSGDVSNLHDVALLGLNYGDANPNTLDVFITNSITAFIANDGTNYGYALTYDAVSSSSPLVGSCLIILDASRSDGVKPFTAPHEAGHILLDAGHPNFPTNLMYGQPYGSTSASDSIQATKRIFDNPLTTLRSASNPAAGMLQNK